MIKERCVTIIPWYSRHNWVADITKYERKTSAGKFKEKKRKRSHHSQSGPKQRKENEKERIKFGW